MPAVALKDGQSQVSCTDGTQGSVCNPDPLMWHWDSSLTSASLEGDTSVMVEGYGVVLEGDAMASHPYGVPCTPTPVNHSPTLNTIVGSPRVYVNGKLVARVGDKYNSDSFDHTISTGASTVFIG